MIESDPNIANLSLYGSVSVKPGLYIGKKSKAHIMISTSNKVIAFAGSMILVNGRRAVIYRELIISKRGCIDTPNKNVSQPLVAIRVNSVFSVLSGVTI